jgi:hypothetical protein
MREALPTQMNSIHFYFIFSCSTARVFTIGFLRNPEQLIQCLWRFVAKEWGKYPVRSDRGRLCTDHRDDEIALMRTALTNFSKTQLLKNGDDLSRLQYGNARHSRNLDCVHSYKLRLLARRPIPAKHLDDFFKIHVELVQRSGLRMRARKAGYISHEKSRVGTAFNNCGIGFHKYPSGIFVDGHSNRAGRTTVLRAAQMSRGQRLSGSDRRNALN